MTCGLEDLAFPFGTPCKDTFGNRLAEEIAADGPVVGAALAQIHVLSPAAKVFVVGYPDILPQSGNCWPTVPLTSGDVSYLNGVEQDLNSMLSSEAAANSATFLDTFTPSIGHDACKRLGVRWVEPVLPNPTRSRCIRTKKEWKPTRRSCRRRCVRRGFPSRRRARLARGTRGVGSY